MDVNALQLILISLFVGAVLGYVSGMLGIGGGLFAVPILALGYGLDQQAAQGTALLVMVPNMAIGFYRYKQHNPITIGMAAMLSIGAIIASYLGALLATKIETSLLRTLVACFMMALSLQMLWRSFSLRSAEGQRKKTSLFFMPFVGGIGGFCAGFFTIGGGVVTIPFLIAIFGFSQTAAQGLVLAMLVPGSTVALATYSLHGFVHWTIAIPMMIGSVFTISWGVHAAHKLPERRLRHVFCGMLFLSSVLLLLR